MALVSGLVFKLIERSKNTGNTFAKVIYQNEVILMINLANNDYILYDTPYRSLVHIKKAKEGIFYVPGKLTLSMAELYESDSYARDNKIVGIKLVIEDEKIRVAYQESPKDLCQLQKPTSSPLFPIVCLPNELVINIYTDIESDDFIPDSILE